MEQQSVDIGRMRRYCTVCEQEFDSHIDKHCTPSSVVAIKKEGLFRKKNRFFTLDGKELSEEYPSRIRAAETLAQAIGMLNDADEETRLAAVVALEKLGWQPGKDAVSARYWIEKGNWNECVGIGAPAVEPLIEVLRFGTVRIEFLERAKLCRLAVVRIGVPAVEPLVNTLRQSEKNPYVRMNAAIGLGEIGGDWALESLIAVLMQDTEPAARQGAAIGLGETGDVRAIEPLITALSDDWSSVRLSAAGALGKLGDVRATEPLSAALKDDKDELVRAAAVEALKKIETMRMLKKTFTAEEAVDMLVEIYRTCPDGVFPGTPAEKQVKAIGQAIYEAGGMALMLEVHFKFEGRNMWMRRDLEMTWDGIGEWRG